MSDWRDEWEEVKPLGEGGQGTSTLVKMRRSPDVLGVLKILRKPEDRQSRLRMYHEASTLRSLDAAREKVPRILDDFTHLVDELDEPLYFVMEYIEGPTVQQVMEERQRLPPELAVELTIDLAKTVGACHALNVTHRDLKPGNLIVRNLERADIVVVDFGLSFNSSEEREPATKPNERIGNGFTNLPERDNPKAQRRFESDLTAVCGHLYYFITGHRPLPFRDEQNKAPHRRGGEYSLSSAIGEHPWLTRLESTLDRAFQYALSERFELAEDLVQRLSALNTVSTTPSLNETIEYCVSSIGRSAEYRRSHALEQAKKMLFDVRGLLLKEVIGSGPSPPGHFRVSAAFAESPIEFDFVPRVPHEAIAIPNASMCGATMGIFVAVKHLAGRASASELAIGIRSGEFVLFERQLDVLPTGSMRPPSAIHATRSNLFFAGGEWIARHIWNPDETDLRAEFLAEARAVIGKHLSAVAKLLGGDA